MSSQTLQQRIREGLREITVLVNEPYSEAANDVLRRIVRRYEETARAFIDDAGISTFPGWVAWLRVLEIRFIQLISADRPTVEAALRREIAKTRETSAKDLMREIVRVCIMEIIEVGKQNKRRAVNDQFPLPKRPDLYWQAAVEEVADRMRDYVKLGHRYSDYGWNDLGGFPIWSILDSPKEWYMAFGKVLNI